MKPFQVFLSYRAEDDKLAEPIRQRLQADGVRVFDPVRDLSPGTQFQKAIEHALDEVTVLLVIFSPNADASPQTEYQYRAFQDKMFSEEGGGQNTIIPLIAGEGSPSSLPRALRQFQAIRVEATEEIVKATLHHLGERGRSGVSDTPMIPSVEPNLTPAAARRVSSQEWIWRLLFLIIGIVLGFLVLDR